MSPSSWKLAIEQARAAVQAAAGHTPAPPTLPNPAELAAHPAPAAPRVRLTPRPRAEAPSRPSCAPAELRAGLHLSPGAVRLHELLVRLAGEVLDGRAHAAPPSRVVFHAPAVLVAAALGYTARHARRLAGELAASGLIAYGAHAARVRGRNLWDGTLWAIRTAVQAPEPRITGEEWRHIWRDLEGDLAAGRTAQALMSGLQARELKSENIFGALSAWAVGRRPDTSPVGCSADMGAASVVYALPALIEAHPRQRAELITAHASALAAHFRDEHSRRWWAGLLHKAVASEHRGERALSALAAALARLMVDVREWPDLARPGALLAARLRPA